jgi:hypothetical protein
MNIKSGTRARSLAPYFMKKPHQGKSHGKSIRKNRQRGPDLMPPIGDVFTSEVFHAKGDGRKIKSRVGAIASKVAAAREAMKDRRAL